MHLKARLCCASAVLIVAASPAYAQTNVSEGQSGQTADPVGTAAPAQADTGISDIIVTARKRSERLQDVPVAITAVTSEQLTRYGTQSLSQISSQTPQLQVGSAATAGGNVISLRGIGSQPAGVTSDQDVSLNLDGVQVGQTNALRLGLHDLDRIEILKGPQALFYGKNSPAGVISILSAEPTNKLTAQLRGGYETYSGRKYVEGFVSGPLTSTVSARLYAYYGDQEGWFRNDAQPLPAYRVPASIGGTGESTSPTTGTTHRSAVASHEVFVRGSLKFASPDNDLEMKLKVSYGKESQDAGFNVNQQLVSCPNGAPTYVVVIGTSGSRDCKLDRYTNEPDIPNFSGLNPHVGNGKLYHDISQTLISASVDYHPVDTITLSSITGYYDLKDEQLGNISYGSASYLGSYIRTHLKQFSQEGRVSTNFDGFFNLMAGGYYQWAKIDGDQAVFADNPYSKFFSGGTLVGPVELTDVGIAHVTRSWSAFGQVRLKITPSLQLTGGARYTRETKRAAAVQRPNAFTPTGYDVIFSPDRVTYDNISPEVTLTKTFGRSLTLYGGFRQGFKSGGFDLNAFTGAFGAANVGDTSFSPETARGFEVGAKGSILDRQIVFDLSVFRYKYKDLQVSTLDPNTLAYRLTNAGSAVAKGVEFSAQYQPRFFPGANLHGTVNYNLTRYSSFRNAPCYAGQSQSAGCNMVAVANPAGGLTLVPATPTTVGNVQDETGRPLARAPEWTGSAGMTYERSILPNWKGGVTFDAIYSSSYYSMAELDPRSFQRSVWRFNASLTARSEDDHWELALIGTNLTNKLRALSGASYAGTGAGTGTPNPTLADLQGTVSDPRTLALQLTLRY
jgi:iron complex outermembrane receptor protein